MSIAERIMKRYRLERKQERAWLLAVVPPHDTPPPSLEDWMAREKRAWIETQLRVAPDPVDFAANAAALWAAKPAAAAQTRWNARLWWYIARDRDGADLMREEPFAFPCDPQGLGLYQERLFPDGIPDRRTGVSTLVTQSTDPFVCARWWWALTYGGVPRSVVVRMQRAKGEPELPRTED